MRILPRHLLLGVAVLLAASAPALAGDAAGDLADFMKRRAAIKDGDAAARVDLARWCRGKELLAQMADMCGEALAIDPTNAAAYSMLREYDATHTMPAEADKEAALQKEFKTNLGHDFKIKNTRHFIILYDTTDAFATARAQQLEQAYDTFYLYFDMQHLRPGFLEKRLVTVAFKSYDDYTRYSREVDGMEVPWAAGYYSGRTNRTAFYDDSTGPVAAKTEKMVADMKQQVTDLAKQISDAQRKNSIAVANDLIRQRNDINGKLLSISLHEDAAVDKLNAVKTLHEATHQLAFNTGIQARGVDYPLWLSEGIATAFEWEARDGTRGPAVVNALRVETVKTALAGGKLTPLKTFLSSSPDKFESTDPGIFYAQSWALVHFLYRTDKAGLEKYLAAYKALTPGARLGPTEQMTLFTDAFGNVDTIEERWKKYLQGI